IGEEYFIELTTSRHRLQWTAIDAWGSHRQQQIRQTFVFRPVRFGSAQQEHHVCVMGGTGPDLLTVHYPEPVPQFRFRLSIRQITAVARLGITLTPDDIAANGRADVSAFLLLG